MSRIVVCGINALAALGVCGLFCGIAPVRADDAKPDAAVQAALRNGLLTNAPDGQFHGEQAVTRTQAVRAIAHLARALEAGIWQTGASPAVPQSIVPTLKRADWHQQVVTRATLAATLARLGDYVAKGLPRPSPTDKDRGRSKALPRSVHLTLPKTSPAYADLAYLASRRMIQSGSPFLQPDARPVRAAELSRGLTEMTLGLTDRLTPLGLDARGETPDATFHQKKNRSERNNQINRNDRSANPILPPG